MVVNKAERLSQMIFDSKSASRYLPVVAFIQDQVTLLTNNTVKNTCG